MDDWQAEVLHGALGEAGPLWSAFEVAVTVPRQNGKGGILEARELAGAMLFGERLIVHTAHEVKTAREAFLRMEAIIERAGIKCRVSRVNGGEGFTFPNGARIKYLARSKGSGRGFSGDLTVMDECMFLSNESIDALLPTMASARNPQIWFTGSAGLAESGHQREVRRRALSGDASSLAYFEWSAPDDAEIDDVAAWYGANPALEVRRADGSGLTEQYVRKERAALSEVSFARERLGIWAPEGGESVIEPDAWSKLADAKSVLSEPATLAVDVNPERTVASIGAASRRPDGRAHVETIENRGGVAWVGERVAGICKARQVTSVVLDSGSAAGSLQRELEGLGVSVTTVGTREYGQACGSFYDAVHPGKGTPSLVHRGQALMAAAIESGRRRALGDAWAWQRRNVKSDITPLVAVTLALFGLQRYEADRPTPSFVPRRVR